MVKHGGVRSSAVTRSDLFLSGQRGCLLFLGSFAALLVSLLNGAAAVHPWLAGGRAAQAQNPPPPAQSGALPAGTVIYLRLDTPISTKASHLNGAVAARVVRDVSGASGVVIPVGAVAQGRLTKVIPSSSPTDRARLFLHFTQLTIKGYPPIQLAGHVMDIDNAREVILQDGTIQGLLASELPLALLENALAKLGKGATDIQRAQQKALGKSDASIDYPAGTDLTLVLTAPLGVNQTFPPVVPEQISAAAKSAVDDLLSQAPQRASGKDGTPGDPLNLVVVGNVAAIQKVFQQAGWSEAEAKTTKSILETVRAVVGNQGYGRAPVSELYLYDRAEDLAFERMLNTFAKRHHLRLWRSTVKTSDGREVWLAAATHDTGLDIRPGVASHAIDPDLDAERAKVGVDLAAAGGVASEQLVTRPNALSEGLTATGAPWKTDGRLLAIELKPN